MMLEKPPHRRSVPEKARLAGLGIDANVRLDDLVHAVQDDLDSIADGLRITPGRAEAIRREKVERFADVDVTVLEVSRADREQAPGRMDHFVRHGRVPRCKIPIRQTYWLSGHDTKRSAVFKW